MKKISIKIGALLVLFFLMSSSMLFAKPGKVTIYGTAEQPRFTELNVYKIVNSQLDIIAHMPIAEDGKYEIDVEIDKAGLYAIGVWNNELNKDIHEVYLKPGERIQMNFTALNYELVGKASLENQQLKAWQEKIRPIQIQSLYGGRGKSETFVNNVNQLAAEIPTILANSKTKNKEFDAFFNDFVKIDLGASAISWLSVDTARIAAANSPYFNSLKDDYYYSDALLVLPNGVNFAPELIKYKLNGKRNFQLEDVVPTLTGDGIRREFFFKIFDRWMDEKAITEESEKYNQLFQDSESKKRLADVLAKSKVKGDPFTLFTVDDKKVKLDQYKGKLVLLDFWATWCGPCLQEAPYWEALREEFKDNPNVQFISISIDQVKPTWKAFEKKSNLPGVRLHAQKDFDMIKTYRITGIPRFMLIGKDGKMIEAHAPRPSHPDFKKMILKYL